MLTEELLADVKHRLRTPMSVVAGLAELLAEGVYGDLSPGQLQRIAMINEAGQGLLRAVDDFIELSEVIAGPSELRLQRIPIKELRDSATALLETPVTRSGIDMKFDLDPALPTIFADRRAMIQMLVHCLKKGIDVTRRSGSLLLQTRAPDRLTIVVSDPDPVAVADIVSGESPPIDPKSNPNRLHVPRNFGDLSVARQLAKWHGGALDVITAGTDIRLVATIPQASASRNGSDPTSGPTRILIVEDNASIAEAIRDYLATKGINVTVAPDGEAGLREAAIHRHSIALIDIRLPGMDGFELMRRLRAESRTSAMVIVAMTGQDAADDRNRCHTAGATAYLPKPLRLHDLGTLIEALSGNGGAADRVPVNYEIMRQELEVRRPIQAPLGADRLSEREIDVLRLLSSGLRNREIAARLHVTEATVKSHVSAVLRKIGASNRAEAVAMSINQRLF